MNKPNKKPVSTGLIITAAVVGTFFIMILAYVVFLEIVSPSWVLEAM